MTAHEMPVLLDGPIAVDADMAGMDTTMALDEVDLFGDPVMPRAPQTKALQQRLDELRCRGCCQTIAWSRQGTIASVAKDGTSIELRFLHCRPDTGDWDLSAPSIYATSPTAASPIPIVHLAWAPTSVPELALIDAAGRISILHFNITLNRAYPYHKWSNDAPEDLNAVVGCYWLPLLVAPSRQYNIMYGPAVWNQTEYKFEQSVTHASGPWHPNHTKSALLWVTTNGFLKLMFPQNNNKIEETSLELDSVTTSDDLVTHASICSDKNQLLIALATASKQLKIIRVAMQWGIPQPGDRQAPPGSIHLSPSLRERNIAITSWLQHGPSESALDTYMSQLSLVEMLPSFVENQVPEAPPVVLTVRSYLPQEGSLYDQGCQSIIDRWELINEQTQTLHPTFEQLGSRNGSGNPPPTARLRKLDSIVLPKVVISIHSIHLGKVICIAFSDGTVQYRDRITMNETYHEQNLSSIMSPHQVGFQFANETPCLQVAFSPTNCSFVQICEDGSVQWNKMQFPLENADSLLQGNHYSAILAALGISIGPAAYLQLNADDVFAIARPFTEKQDFAYAWVRSIINMMKVPVDYSEESHHDQLVRNQNLQFCLSIVNHLGFRGEFQPRSFGGKFAMLALNVRNIVILITLANNAPMNLKEKLSPLDDPEVVGALAGCAKWAVDLLSWLADCIFELLDDDTFRGMLEDPKRFSELSTYMRSRGDVSLHLLLCSSTRGFLTAACRRLLHFETMSTRARQYYEKQVAQQPRDGQPPRPTPALYLAYMKMQRATSSSLIKIHEFERLIMTLGQEIRANYQKTLSGLVPKGGRQDSKPGTASDQLVKKAQAHCELDMLLGGNPPPSFREMLLRFFQTNVVAFRNQTDVAELYFGNFELLEVDDDEKSLAARRERGVYIDVFKRVPLARASPVHSGSGAGDGAAGSGVVSGSGGADETPQWRRCVRCASVMEDVYGNKPAFTFVLAQQRKCSCGGNWGLWPRGSVVS